VVTTYRTGKTRRLERFGRGYSPAQYQVICFPHAGGGAAAFAPLAAAAAAAAADVAITAFRPPGRENLLGEPALLDAEPMIECAVDLIKAENPRDYAILGQCTGAYLALEVGRRLSAALEHAPRCVFVAAQSPPSWDELDSGYPEEDLDAQVQRLAIDPVLTSSEDFMAMYRATLEADVAVARSYLSGGPYPPLGTPLVALCCSAEDSEFIRMQEAWRSFTTDSFEVRVIEGGPHLITAADPELVLNSL
jgi:surfactin synthase thioesterase subunit